MVWLGATSGCHWPHLALRFLEAVVHEDRASFRRRHLRLDLHRWKWGVKIRQGSDRMRLGFRNLGGHVSSPGARICFTHATSQAYLIPRVEYDGYTKLRSIENFVCDLGKGTRPPEWRFRVPEASVQGCLDHDNRLFQCFFGRCSCSAYTPYMLMPSRSVTLCQNAEKRNLTISRPSLSKRREIRRCNVLRPS